MTMGYLASMESEIEEAVAHVPEMNRAAARNKVRWLLMRAEPGNWAWHKLENDWGFSGDYLEGDHGMHWSDNNK